MDNANENISIRHSIPADARLISVLATTTFYEAYCEQDESDNLAGYISQSFDVHKIESELADPSVIFLLIYRSNKAVGYAKLDKESTLDCIAGPAPIELKRIYILERVYGKGFGARLLEYCIDLAKNLGFETIWLQVWEENPRAQRFYQKYGFKQCGKIDIPYGEVTGTNLVLQKSLIIRAETRV